MIKVRKSSIKNRRYTNPEILYDCTKSKLYYFTSSIREWHKYLRGEEEAYTLEEVIKRFEEKKELLYKNA